MSEEQYRTLCNSEDEVSIAYKKALDDYRAGNKDNLINIIKTEQKNIRDIK